MAKNKRMVIVGCFFTVIVALVLTVVLLTHPQENQLDPEQELTPIDVEGILVGGPGAAGEPYYNDSWMIYTSGNCTNFQWKGVPITGTVDRVEDWREGDRILLCCSREVLMTAPGSFAKTYSIQVLGPADKGEAEEAIAFHRSYLEQLQPPPDLPQPDGTA